MSKIYTHTYILFYKKKKKKLNNDNEENNENWENYVSYEKISGNTLDTNTVDRTCEDLKE